MAVQTIATEEWYDFFLESRIIRRCEGSNGEKNEREAGSRLTVVLIHDDSVSQIVAVYCGYQWQGRSKPGSRFAVLVKLLQIAEMMGLP